MKLNVRELKSELKEIGFKMYYPIVSTWSESLIYRYDRSILCVLFRKNGVDFKLYKNYEKGLEVRDRNRISMVGGVIFRNHYNASEINIHDKILDIACSFVQGDVKENDIKNEDGRSYKLNQSYIDNLNAAKNRNTDDCLRSALSGCEDADGRIYLCDGIYI